jgi:4-hydroxy-tetrahydrodipicolinate reductase
MAATKIAVCGAAGRMGRRIIALATEDSAAQISGALEAADNSALGSDAGELAAVGKLGIVVTDDIGALCAAGNVIVDFTSADATVEHVRMAADRGNAIVVGASGFSAEQRAEMEGLADRVPILIAANMSVGVTVLLTLVEDAIKRLGPGFDCEIVEIHHNRKKDSPSGTALALGEAAANARGLDPARALVLAREGMVGERSGDEIGIVALRGGDAAGEHTVMLVGAGERVELIHRAASRDAFASGAVAAAKWLDGKPAGLYSMRNVVGLD